MERWDSYKGCALQKILFGNSPSIWFPLSYMYEKSRQKSIETASRWFKVSKYSLTISEVCVIFFSLGFSSFPDALMCVLTCVGLCKHAYRSLLCNNQITLLSQTYFCAGFEQFLTIPGHQYGLGKSVKLLLSSASCRCSGICFLF